MFKTFILFKKQKNGRIKKKKRSGSWWKSTKGERKNYLFILYAHPHISLPLFHGPRDDGFVVALDQKWKHFLLGFKDLLFQAAPGYCFVFYIFFINTKTPPTTSSLIYDPSFHASVCSLVFSLQIYRVYKI